MSGLFHVYFDGNNWVGLVLEESEDSTKSGKFIFGPEPTPTEIFEWAKKGCPGLVLNSVPRKNNTERQKEPLSLPISRELRRAKDNKPLGSYAQDVLRRTIELKKKSASVSRKEQRALEAETRYEKNRLKKKKKKRGH